MLGDEGTLLGIAAIVAALLAGLPGVIAAVYGRKVHKEVRNPNGTTTGNAVEAIRQTTGAPEMPKVPHPENQDTPPTPPKE